MSSERQAFNDGFDKGFSKSLEKMARLEAELEVVHAYRRVITALMESKNRQLQQAQEERDALIKYAWAFVREEGFPDYGRLAKYWEALPENVQKEIQP